MNVADRQTVPVTPFLQGSFRAFSLDEIFGVLALSRQTFGMRFSDADREVGAITVKAGQVIGAEDYRSRAEGADALKALVGNPGTGFAVIMLPRNSPEVRADAVIARLGEVIPQRDDGDPDAAQAPPAGSAPAAPDEATRDEQAGEDMDPEFRALADIESVERELPALADIDGETGDVRPDPAPPDEVSAAPDEVILHGNVTDASFEEILEVLQLSEQPLVVSFMRGGAEIGTLSVMSEQVLAATAGALRGIEAFRRLYADHGEAFEVRRASGGAASQALGSVTELLAEGEQRLPFVDPTSAPQRERSLFMQGKLSDFPLDFIIGSLDLSRQSMELELRRDEKILHRVQLKAGRIAAVNGTSGDGVDAALAAIRADPGDEFLIYRCPGTIDEPAVAPLAALVSESGPPAAQELPDRDRDPARMADERELLSQTATAVSRLLVDLEDAHNGAIGEIRNALTEFAPRRRDRALLWALLALQSVCLTVTIALLALTVL